MPLPRRKIISDHTRGVRLTTGPFVSTPKGRPDYRQSTLGRDTIPIGRLPRNPATANEPGELPRPSVFEHSPRKTSHRERRGRHQNGIQSATNVCQPILYTDRSLRYNPSFDNPEALQFLQPSRENLGRDALHVLLQSVELSHAEEHLPEDQDGPALPYDTKGRLDRTRPQLGDSVNPCHHAFRSHANHLMPGFQKDRERLSLSIVYLLSMAETMTVLVAGATGHQGGAVSRSLAKRGHRVKALTRNPTKASPLEKLGAQVVQGDLTDFRSVVHALRKTDGFFVMTTPFERGLDDEVRQGITALDAAKEVGGGHVVLTSVSGADQNSGVPHYETKARVEEHLHSIGIPATIVRPVLFMETLLSPRMLQGIGSGTLALPLKPETKLRLVATKDIGEIVARAFENPEKGKGRAWDLVGDSRTMPDVAALLSKRLARPVKFVQLPEDRALQAMGEGMLKMFRWLDARGPAANVAPLEEHWDYRMTQFETLLGEAQLQL